jgi:DNA-binding NarL/FixJ family response regulator
MAGIQVVLFDDNELIRDSITLLFADSNDFELAGSFPSCENIIENIEHAKPDVVIMDIDMPGINGIEGVRIIRKSFPSVQVLMHTVFDNDEKIFAAIKAGAGGYILKNAESQHLLAAVTEVFNGGAPMTPAIARRVLQQFQHAEAAENEDYQLSPREQQVLSLLVQGLSYKMIAGKLEITYSTVRAHMKKIYEKLHVSSMTEAVAKAINQKFFP